MRRRAQGNRRLSDTVDEDEYLEADAGASLTTPTQASSLRKGGYAMLKARPCKIVEISTSKTGKHGHAKVHIVGLDIFSGKKCEDLCPSSHNIDVPIVNKNDYQVANLTEGGHLFLMDSKGQTRSDLTLPDGKLGDTIQEKFDDDKILKVTVLRAMGQEVLTACRSEKKR